MLTTPADKIYKDYSEKLRAAKVVEHEEKERLTEQKLVEESLSLIEKFRLTSGKAFPSSAASGAESQSGIILPPEVARQPEASPYMQHEIFRQQQSLMHDETVARQLQMKWQAEDQYSKKQGKPAVGNKELLDMKNTEMLNQKAAKRPRYSQPESSTAAASHCSSIAETPRSTSFPGIQREGPSDFKNQSSTARRSLTSSLQETETSVASAPQVFPNIGPLTNLKDFDTRHIIRQKTIVADANSFFNQSFDGQTKSAMHKHVSFAHGL